MIKAIILLALFIQAIVGIKVNPAEFTYEESKAAIDTAIDLQVIANSATTRAEIDEAAYNLAYKLTDGWKDKGGCEYIVKPCSYVDYSRFIGVKAFNYRTAGLCDRLIDHCNHNMAGFVA